MEQILKMKRQLRNRLCSFYFDYLLKVKGNLLVGKLSVDSCECIGPSFDIGLVFGVKVNLKDALSVHLHPGSLTDNLSRVADILQNSVVDSRQRS